MTRQWMRVVAGFAAVAMATASASAGAADAPLSSVVPATSEVTVAPPTQLRFLPPGDAVAFHGVVNYDGAGLGDGQMLYVGGPIGLVVGVIAHSLISNSRRQRQKDEITERADMVLEPYADAIAGFKQRELLERSFAGMTTVADKSIGDPGAVAGAAWVIEYVPVFAMSQDRRAIVLDNAVSITRPNGPAGAPYQNTIRVVSAPRPVQDSDWWEVDHSANLEAESARLLAMSFDIALAEARRGRAGGASTPVQRTLRYVVGENERMERAEPIGQTCDRIVMRTLRGWLLSAPVSRAQTTDSDGRPCAAAVAATPG